MRITGFHPIHVSRPSEPLRTVVQRLSKPGSPFTVVEKRSGHARLTQRMAREEFFAICRVTDDARRKIALVDTEVTLHWRFQTRHQGKLHCVVLLLDSIETQSSDNEFLLGFHLPQAMGRLRNIRTSMLSILKWPDVRVECLGCYPVGGRETLVDIPKH